MQHTSAEISMARRALFGWLSPYHNPCCLLVYASKRIFQHCNLVHIRALAAKLARSWHAQTAHIAVWMALAWLVCLERFVHTCSRIREYSITTSCSFQRSITKSGSANMLIWRCVTVSGVSGCSASSICRCKLSCAFPVRCRSLLPPTLLPFVCGSQTPWQHANTKPAHFRFRHFFTTFSPWL